MAQTIKNLPAVREMGFNSWVRKIPWRREWLHTLVFLPGKSEDRGAWWATVHGVIKRKDMTKLLTSTTQTVVFCYSSPDGPRHSLTNVYIFIHTYGKTDNNIFPWGRLVNWHSQRSFKQAVETLNNNWCPRGKCGQEKRRYCKRDKINLLH